jgi:hypothetical protein
MLINEEITRLKVREAVQSGLKAQQIQHALKDHKSQQATAMFVIPIPATHSSSKLQTGPGWLHALLLPLITFLKL